MATELRALLEKYRAESKTEREKGGYFERLVRVWLENAPTQKGQFLRVLPYAEWAAETGAPRNDTGIDIVAQLKDSPDDWCAIQCKFYDEHYRIQKSDIDSFFTASGKRPFERRLIVDSTGAPWSANAQDALVDQRPPCTRVGLSDLEESGLDWGAFARDAKVVVKKKKEPREHQKDALKAVEDGLAEADRGKLIMACGTGKTYTALTIAEKMAGPGGRVLFLVPSLSLMSQTIREWSIDATISLRSFAVCSDSQVGVVQANRDDLADISATDLEIPATTRATTLAERAKANDAERMTVVFSTYHSIDTVADAQARLGLPAFDLIICDEAHRTTGATLENEEESAFVRVHDGDYIKGKKRLYMTATPRIFGDQVKKVADEAGAILASMDDESLYGKELFTRNFSWAVENKLLCDYKVVVLAVDEGSFSEGIQRMLADRGNELKLDDATKIVGCYKALTKTDLKPDTDADPAPMRRALAFTKTIAASKTIEREFARVAQQWRDDLDAERAAALPRLEVEVGHVDGGFSANLRNERLSWLKEDAGDDHCRILSNARCLSEGVDVPALDAILFLHPRKSQIDVVQSVGRVMRRADEQGKKMGYVILPIGVPAGIAPEQALNDNERYRVVWQILNALRAHDDRLDATINKMEFGVDPGDRIEIVAVSNALPTRSSANKQGLGIGEGGASDAADRQSDSAPAKQGDGQLAFDFPEYAKAIKAKMVKRCGTRAYLETWAADVARIAQIHITRIKAAVGRAGSEEKAAWRPTTRTPIGCVHCQLRSGKAHWKSRRRR